MIYWFDTFRDMSFSAILIRMLLAMLCGGMIGLERGFKRRAAGLRTHILICLGAAITTLTSQYLLLVQSYYTDIARLGAQVIAGVGLIVAGTIIVTRQNRVKGLTTAAGIWTTAIIGLAIGTGFLEAAIATTLLILFTELVISKMEYKMLANSSELNLYIEYTGKDALDNLLMYLRENMISLIDFEITRKSDTVSNTIAAIFSLRLPRKKGKHNSFIDSIRNITGIISVIEL